jgi:GNAT superfamily N-acetyltransferase
VGVTVSIRRISPAQWSSLRDVRLLSLRDSPGAFGQSYDAAAAMPDDEWKSIARASSAGQRRVWFIAWNDAAEPVGVVQARRRPPADCLLFSMWVAPDARREGVGAALVDSVSAWARGWDAKRVILWVIGTNEGAYRFYERIGFSVLADGPDAESGHAYGALAMERPV